MTEHRARQDRRGQRRREQVRRRRTVLVVAVLLIVIAIVGALVGPHGDPGRQAGSPASKRQGPIPAVEAGLLPWQLSQPLSRELLMPGRGRSVTIVGGLNSAGQSTTGIFKLDTANGSLT